MGEYEIVDKDTYLAHYGILGMHWGIRRSQNKDGSFTKNGKLRYVDYAEKKAVKAINEKHNAYDKTIQRATLVSWAAARTAGLQTLGDFGVKGSLGDVQIGKVLAAGMVGANFVNKMMRSSEIANTRLGSIDARTSIVVND